MTIALAWLSIFGGHLFALRTGRQWGHAASIAGSLLLTWEAIPDWHPQRVVLVRVASGQQMSEILDPKSEIRDPKTDVSYPISEFPFIASVNKKTYHLRDGGCGHAKLIDKETAIYIQSDAVGDRVPCRNCFRDSIAIALPVQPDSPARTRPAPLAHPEASPSHP